MESTDEGLIVDMLTGMFGDSHAHNEYRHQISFDCPVCSYDIKGLDKGDGKGNLGEHTVSVCTADHAVHANLELQQVFAKAKAGEKQTLVIGTGHGMCTCQGAAFEYVFNVEHEANKAGVRDMLDIQWISNESFLGDFGIGGLHMKRGGYAASSRLFAESLY